MADPIGRPEWAGPRAQLVAQCEDLSSGQRFRAWYEQETPRPRRRLSRARPLPFSVEHEASGTRIGLFAAWGDVSAWQQSNVICEGWQVLRLPEEERQRMGLPLEEQTQIIITPSSA